MSQVQAVYHVGGAGMTKVPAKTFAALRAGEPAARLANIPAGAQNFFIIHHEMQDGESLYVVRLDMLTVLIAADGTMDSTQRLAIERLTLGLERAVRAADYASGLYRRRLQCQADHTAARLAAEALNEELSALSSWAPTAEQLRLIHGAGLPELVEATAPRAWTRYALRAIRLEKTPEAGRIGIYTTENPAEIQRLPAGAMVKVELRDEHYLLRDGRDRASKLIHALLTGYAVASGEERPAGDPRYCYSYDSFVAPRSFLAWLLGTELLPTCCDITLDELMR